MKRMIKIPKIYKHFKGNLYGTYCLSFPLEAKEFKGKTMILCKWANHTESRLKVPIIERAGKFYHPVDIEKESLVIYAGITEPAGHLWARPINMFLSKVDRDKYPDSKQEYRFEEVEV